MPDKDRPSRARRLILNSLAAAPALIGISRLSVNRAIGEPSSQASAAPTADDAPTAGGALTAENVLNIADFEALARAKLPPAHFGYIATGVDDDRTVFLNHDACTTWCGKPPCSPASTFHT